MCSFSLCQVCAALLCCVSDSLRPLAHKFLRFALQIVARLTAWLAAVEAGDPAASAAVPTSSAGPAAVPVQLCAADWKSVALDCRRLASWLKGPFESLLLEQAEREEAALVAALLGEAAFGLEAAAEAAWERVAAHVISVCANNLAREVTTPFTLFRVLVPRSKTALCIR